MTRPPDALRARYQEGRLIPFIGAGFSQSISWANGRGISWGQLVDQAARLLNFEDPDLLKVRGNALQILEYYRSQNNNEFVRLRDWFVQTRIRR